MFGEFLDMGAFLTPGFICTVKIKCLVLVELLQHEWLKKAAAKLSSSHA